MQETLPIALHGARGGRHRDAGASPRDRRRRGATDKEEGREAQEEEEKDQATQSSSAFWRDQWPVLHAFARRHEAALNPCYAAPEARTCTAAADVYSWACLAVNVATGAPAVSRQGAARLLATAAAAGATDGGSDEVAQPLADAVILGCIPRLRRVPARLRSALCASLQPVAANRPSAQALIPNHPPAAQRIGRGSHVVVSHCQRGVAWGKLPPTALSGPALARFLVAPPGSKGQQPLSHPVATAEVHTAGFSPEAAAAARALGTAAAAAFTLCDRLEALAAQWPACNDGHSDPRVAMVLVTALLSLKERAPGVGPHALACSTVCRAAVAALPPLLVRSEVLPAVAEALEHAVDAAPGARANAEGGGSSGGGGTADRPDPATEAGLALLCAPEAVAPLVQAAGCGVVLAALVGPAARGCASARAPPLARRACAAMLVSLARGAGLSAAVVERYLWPPCTAGRDRLSLPRGLHPARLAALLHSAEAEEAGRGAVGAASSQRRVLRACTAAFVPSEAAQAAMGVAGALSPWGAGRCVLPSLLRAVAVHGAGLVDAVAAVRSAEAEGGAGDAGDLEQARHRVAQRQHRVMEEVALLLWILPLLPRSAVAGAVLCESSPLLNLLRAIPIPNGWHWGAPDHDAATTSPGAADPANSVPASLRPALDAALAGAGAARSPRAGSAVLEEELLAPEPAPLAAPAASLLLLASRAVVASAQHAGAKLTPSHVARWGVALAARLCSSSSLPAPLGAQLCGSVLGPLRRLFPAHRPLADAEALAERAFRATVAPWTPVLPCATTVALGPQPQRPQRGQRVSSPDPSPPRPKPAAASPPAPAPSKAPAQAPTPVVGPVPDFSPRPPTAQRAAPPPPSSGGVGADVEMKDMGSAPAPQSPLHTPPPARAKRPSRGRNASGPRSALSQALAAADDAGQVQAAAPHTLYMGEEGMIGASAERTAGHARPAADRPAVDTSGKEARWRSEAQASQPDALSGAGTGSPVARVREDSGDSRAHSRTGSLVDRAPLDAGGAALHDGRAVGGESVDNSSEGGLVDSASANGFQVEEGDEGQLALRCEPLPRPRRGTGAFLGGARDVLHTQGTLGGTPDAGVERQGSARVGALLPRPFQRPFFKRLFGSQQQTTPAGEEAHEADANAEGEEREVEGERQDDAGGVLSRARRAGVGGSTSTTRGGNTMAAATTTMSAAAGLRRDEELPPPLQHLRTQPGQEQPSPAAAEEAVPSPGAEEGSKSTHSRQSGSRAGGRDSAVSEAQGMVEVWAASAEAPLAVLRRVGEEGVSMAALEGSRQGDREAWMGADGTASSGSVTAPAATREPMRLLVSPPTYAGGAGPRVHVADSPVTHVAVTSGEEVLVAACEDGTIAAADLQPGGHTARTTVGGRVCSLHVHGQARRAVVCTRSAVWLWIMGPGAPSTLWSPPPRVGPLTVAVPLVEAVPVRVLPQAESDSESDAGDAGVASGDEGSSSEEGAEGGRGAAASPLAGAGEEGEEEGGRRGAEAREDSKEGAVAAAMGVEKHEEVPGEGAEREREGAREESRPGDADTEHRARQSQQPQRSHAAAASVQPRRRDRAAAQRRRRRRWHRQQLRKWAAPAQDVGVARRDAASALGWAGMVAVGTASGAIHVVDASARHPVMVLSPTSPHGPGQHCGSVLDLCVAASGSWLVSLNDGPPAGGGREQRHRPSRRLRLWDLRTGRALGDWAARSGAAACRVWSVGSHTVLEASGSGDLALWRLRGVPGSGADSGGDGLNGVWSDLLSWPAWRHAWGQAVVPDPLACGPLHVASLRASLRNDFSPHAARCFDVRMYRGDSVELVVLGGGRLGQCVAAWAAEGRGEWRMQRRLAVPFVGPAAAGAAGHVVPGSSSAAVRNAGKQDTPSGSGGGGARRGGEDGRAAGAPQAEPEADAGMRGLPAGEAGGAVVRGWREPGEASSRKPRGSMAEALATFVPSRDAQGRQRREAHGAEAGHDPAAPGQHGGGAGGVGQAEGDAAPLDGTCVLTLPLRRMVVVGTRRGYVYGVH